MNKSLLMDSHSLLLSLKFDEKEVMASNVSGIINLFISILFKYKTCSRKNFHQIMRKFDSAPK